MNFFLEQGLNLAEAATKILFQSNLESLAKLKIEDLDQVFPLSTISQIIFEPGISILDLTMKVGCFKTKGNDYFLHKITINQYCFLANNR